MIGPCGLLVVVFHPFTVLVSILWGGVAKIVITKIRCEKYFWPRALKGPGGGALANHELSNQKFVDKHQLFYTM